MKTLVIVKGATSGYPVAHSEVIVGDFSSWLPRGEIRSNYGEPVLASWRFSPPTYDPLLNLTTVSYWLSAEDSKSIPLPELWESSAIRRGLTGSRYVTDIELAHPTNPTLVLNLLQGGLVQVLPEVTLIEDSTPAPSLPSAGEYEASIGLSALRVVRLNDSGLLAYASPEEYTAIVGVLAAAVSAGELIRPLVIGPLSDPSWSWNISSPIYLGSEGILTQVMPSTGAIVMIGYPTSQVSMQVSIDQPIHQEEAA